MIVVGGVRSFRLKTVQVTGISCKNCQAISSLYLSFFQNYLHFFWIPVFPVGKECISVCTECKQTLKGKQLPEDINNFARNEFITAKTPWYSFIGTVLGILLILGGIIYNIEHDKQSEEYLRHPEKGDIYEYQQEKGGYSFLKVTGTTKDKIYFNDSNYEYNSNPTAGKIDFKETDFFAPDEYEMTLTELETMYKNHKITDVVRQ